MRQTHAFREGVGIFGPACAVSGPPVQLCSRPCVRPATAVAAGDSSRRRCQLYIGAVPSAHCRAAYFSCRGCHARTQNSLTAWTTYAATRQRQHMRQHVAPSFDGDQRHAASRGCLPLCHSWATRESRLHRLLQGTDPDYAWAVFVIMSYVKFILGTPLYPAMTLPCLGLCRRVYTEVCDLVHAIFRAKKLLLRAAPNSSSFEC